MTIRVAGISYYQSAAANCSSGDTVELIPEPNNPYDRNAVRVDYHGRKIGYLPRDLAQELISDVNAGNVKGVISNILGGGVGYNVGVELTLRIREQDSSPIEPPSKSNFFVKHELDQAVLLMQESLLVYFAESTFGSNQAHPKEWVIHPPSCFSLGEGIRYDSEDHMRKVQSFLFQSVWENMNRLSKIEGYKVHNPSETSFQWRVSVTSEVLEHLVNSKVNELIIKVCDEVSGSFNINPLMFRGHFSQLYDLRKRLWIYLHHRADMDEFILPLI